MQNTTGARLLSAIIRDANPFLLTRIPEEWFQEGEESDCFTYVNRHFTQYGRLPTYEIMAMQGFRLPETADPYEYLHDETLHRSSYNAILPLIETLSSNIGNGDTQACVEAIRDVNTQLSGAQGSREVFTISELGSMAVREARQRRARRSGQVVFGYQPLDDELLGCDAGDMLLLAGRPKLGKTYISLNMVVNAWMNGASVMVVSMEMSEVAIAKRIISIAARVDPSILRGRTADELSLSVIENTIAGFNGYPPMHIIGGNFRKTPAQIESYVREYRPTLWFVDGAYLVSPNDRNSRTAKHEVLATVAQELKATGENTNSVGFCTVQFNRMAGGTNRNRNQRNSRGSTSDLDLEFLGGTDAFAQIPSYLIGISHVGSRLDRRRIKALAAREAAADVDMLTDFSMSPLNFGYISDFEEGDVESGDISEIDAQTQAELL